jgi:FtsH-binding integral membrane protein
MVFRVRSETDFARIRAMLDLSVSTFKIYMLSFLMMGLTGLTMPFLIHIWNKVWIWLSIGLILFVVVWMFAVNEK